MLFLTDSFRVDMMPKEETQIQMVPIFAGNVRVVIGRYGEFLSCFRKEDVARKFVEETGLDATINNGYINLSPGDKVLNVTKNEEGDLVYWWINPLYMEEC
tara:strand:- start:961 stop:1263 length:303 start_codon:yes stop_codon:yes gene_type:complete